MNLADHRPFLDALFLALEATPGAFDPYFLDHICYRTETTEQYHNMRDALARAHLLLVESIVGGRRIATFQLAQPLPYRNRLIPLLELPEPKPGRPYAAGWEHVEFVTDRPLVDFASHLPTLLPTTIAPIDRSGMTKTHNPDLRVRLGNEMSVKFHEQPLEEVIKLERNS